MKKGQETRRTIVAEAAPLFNQKGFEGTSLSDLMRVTGLQKGGIYRHFSGKEELAAEAFDYSWERAEHEGLAGVATIPNCADRLKKIIENFVELRAGLVAGGCPLMNTAVEADDGNTKLRARAKKALESWTSRLEKVTIEGIEKNQINRNVDVRNLAQLIIASLEGALLIARLKKSNDPLRNVRQHLDEYIEQSVRARYP